MKTIPLFLLVCLLLGGCCRGPRWPAGVKVGANVVVVITGETSAQTGKVLRVERQWLTVEVRGTPVHFSRDKITQMVVVP